MTAAQAATVSSLCRFCPGPTGSDGLILDRAGQAWPVCTDCALSCWVGDWSGIELDAFMYQMGGATTWELLTQGWRAHRKARRWARAVRLLMSPATPTKEMKP